VHHAARSGLDSHVIPELTVTAFREIFQPFEIRSAADCTASSRQVTGIPATLATRELHWHPPCWITAPCAALPSKANRETSPARTLALDVIRNGVDLDRFSLAPEAGRIRRELRIPGNAPIVAVASRLRRLKDIDKFLEAAAVVARRFPDVRFVLIGETSPADRSYLDDLTAPANRLGLRRRVVFTGLRDDGPGLLACAAVSVMPSVNEALSNVLLESMAAGATRVRWRDRSAVVGSRARREAGARPVNACDGAFRSMPWCRRYACTTRSSTGAGMSRSEGR
jgi:glycosyltransferase involved in cell wall biosynthesis